MDRAAGNRRAIAFSATLALLTLIAQWVVLQHQSDFDAHQDTELCDVCLVGHASDHALAGDVSPPGPAPATRLQRVQSFTAFTATAPVTVRARAPPSLIS